MNNAQFIGAISQLNAKKPLSSFMTYNLLVYSDGILFTQEKISEVIKTAGAMGAGVGGGSVAGIAGGIIGEQAASGHIQKEFDTYTNQESSMDRNALISNPKNHWYQKGQITAIAIKKGWFVDKITVTLTDGTVIKCGSKRGYKQRDSILNYLPSVFPQTVVS